MAKVPYVRAEILNLLKKKKNGMKAGDISVALEMKEPNVRQAILALLKNGELTKVQGKNSRDVTYKAI